MNHRTMCTLVLAIGMATGSVWARDAARAKAKIGKPAPDFTLKSTDGKDFKLSDLAGKVVVLEWTNHECPVVGRYVVGGKKMQKTAAMFKDTDVVWLSIDSSHFCEEKLENIKKFRLKNGIEYPTLLDASGKVGKTFGAKTTPHMFVIDRKGVLIYAGPLDTDQYGDKPDARNYVMEAVTAGMSGSAPGVSEAKPFGCSVKYKR